MKKYTTNSGDMWDIISKSIYGTENNTDLLIDANPNYASVLMFSGGIVLSIPEIESGSQSESLPPWKK